MYPLFVVHVCLFDFRWGLHHFGQHGLFEGVWKERVSMLNRLVHELEGPLSAWERSKDRIEHSAPNQEIGRILLRMLQTDVRTESCSEPRLVE